MKVKYLFMWKKISAYWPPWRRIRALFSKKKLSYKLVLRFALWFGIRLLHNLCFGHNWCVLAEGYTEWLSQLVLQNQRLHNVHSQSMPLCRLCRDSIIWKLCRGGCYRLLMMTNINLVYHFCLIWLCDVFPCTVSGAWFFWRWWSLWNNVLQSPKQLETGIIVCVSGQYSADKTEAIFCFVIFAASILSQSAIRKHRVR